jgi:hypothetical protein
LRQDLAAARVDLAAETRAAEEAAAEVMELNALARQGIGVKWGGGVEQESEVSRGLCESIIREGVGQVRTGQVRSLGGR